MLQDFMSWASFKLKLFIFFTFSSLQTVYVLMYKGAFGIQMAQNSCSVFLYNLLNYNKVTIFKTKYIIRIKMDTKIESSCSFYFLY